MSGCRSCLLQKARVDLAHRFGPGEEGQDRGQHLQAGVRQRVRHPPGQGFGVQGVIGPADDAGGHIQRSQGRQVGQDDPVDDGLERGGDGGAVMAGAEASDGVNDLFGPAQFRALDLGRTLQPDVDAFLFHQVARCPDVLSLVIGFIHKRGRGDQQPLHPPRMGQGEGQRGGRAHGLAAHDGALDAQRVQDGGDVLAHATGVIEGRVGHRRGLAVAPLVEGDDAIAVGQGRELALGSMALARQPVGEDEGRALAKDLHGQGQAIGIDVEELGVVHERSLGDKMAG